MNINLWFNLATIVAIACVLSVIYVFFPESAWSSLPFSISAFALSISVGYIFYIPSILNNNKNIAAKFAVIGPQTLIVLIMLGLTFTSFRFAILGSNGLAFVFDILALSFLLISHFLLKASIQIIQNTSEKYSKSSNHIKWQNELRAITSQTEDKNLKNQLMQVIDSLRYASSDVSESTPHDEEIKTNIFQIKDAVLNNSTLDFNSSLIKIKMLIELRNNYLKSFRNKA
jgi:hypothetical protein